ncbi:hypothetical protein L208DRAFT_1471812 [Tricholoma matsutake]|nr:hypothetical protein L208DRAFT_1471812 [Tricholoma matsutake 945]
MNVTRRKGLSGKSLYCNKHLLFSAQRKHLSWRQLSASACLLSERSLWVPLPLIYCVVLHSSTLSLLTFPMLVPSYPATLQQLQCLRHILPRIFTFSWRMNSPSWRTMCKIIHLPLHLLQPPGEQNSLGPSFVVIASVWGILLSTASQKEGGWRVRPLRSQRQQGGRHMT